MKKIALASAAFALSIASAASASPGYPDAMKADLSLGAAPSCDLCHAEASAPVGDATMPFAKSLLARGLEGHEDDASLASALEKDRGVDSDGDGAEDLDELSWGGDPNHSDAPTGEAPPAVTYGCGGNGSQHGMASTGALALIAGLAFSMRRRRRSDR